MTKLGKVFFNMYLLLAHGAEKELIYGGVWVRKPGVAICTCNDGLRPVVFKLETITE